MSAAEAADAAQDAAQCGGLEVCAETGSPSTEMAEAADSRNGDFKPFHSMNREELVNALREILAVGRLDAYREVNGVRARLIATSRKRMLSVSFPSSSKPETTLRTSRPRLTNGTRSSPICRRLSANAVRSMWPQRRPVVLPTLRTSATS